MGWTYSTHRKDKQRVQYLVGEPEGKGPFWRVRSKLDNNIKTDHRKIVCGLDSSGSG